MTDLLRRRKDFEQGLQAMTEAAIALADSIIAQAPSRHVSAEELAQVETFVIDYVLKEARAELEKAGASPLALAFADGPVAGELTRIFKERFREQAPLMLAKHGGRA